MTVDVDWREVLPPETPNEAASATLHKADALREIWQSRIESMTAGEIFELRQRALRRHAIETGIIERLYDVDWGVTDALVADGLSMEVASREGSLSDDALDTIRTQFEALVYLSEYAQDGRDLTVFFIRELHVALTRNQEFYDAHDALGRPVRVRLRHGEFKTSPNHVKRSDGSIYRYTPPERVQDQLEELIRQYQVMDGEHPILVAAWLHHRFICIHPFADGNGRVARALSLLVLLKRRYAPLVVDRESREAYIAALDSANDGDISNLVELFANLEIVALRAELEVRLGAVASSSPVTVARALADRLEQRRALEDEARRDAANLIASRILDRIEVRFEELATGIVEEFKRIDPKARSSVTTGRAGSREGRYWYSQIVQSAREVGFFANLSEGAWWCRLHLRVQELLMRYALVVQKVGRGETGVLAVTFFAESLRGRNDVREGDELPDEVVRAGEESARKHLLRLSAKDSVTILISDNAEDRWPEISEAVERTLSAAVANFAESLS